ncbi:MAG: MBL fold metallo-hydrolase [Tannerella sp.]|jgi:L-ascorbate metabolism protein UlaG (beta-lactamase superfamily)|nr:MBL fold metallo-hydrolase [Tannerella sp.]
MKHEIKFVSNPDLAFVKKDFRGNVVIDGIFCNADVKDKPPTWKAVKWKLSANPQREEKKKDTFKLETVIDRSFIENNDDVTLWLGHSFFYIRLDGTVYLTDPIESDLPTAEREVAVPYGINELGKIDYILLSHAHFDHFDIPTLKKIVAANPDVEILGPLGMNTLLKGDPFVSVSRQEAGWFQTYKTGEHTITFLPAKHWSRRGLFDFNNILWGGFAISSKSIKIYFAGDTAKEPDFFSAIDSLYKGFDLCFIPVGSYSPRFLMEEEHVNPEEALELFQTLNGKHFIPMHYGTYDLSDEPLGEPIERLKENARRMGIIDSIHDISVGEPVYIDKLFDLIWQN